MQRMRAVVKEHNVYRWAENLIAELAGVRLETASPTLTVLPAAVPPAVKPHAEYKVRIAG